MGFRLAKTAFAALSLAVAAPAAPAFASRLGWLPPAEPFEEIEAFFADGAAGTLTLPGGAPDRLSPAVLILHDGPDPDGRAGPYADQLLGAGIAVLELLAHDEGEGVATALASLARHPRVAGQPVGVLGFGAGGQVALRLPGPLAARAALYPGCAASLGPPPGRPAIASEAVLLLHGEADAANPVRTCAALADSLARGGAAVRWLAYRHAGYAWDRPLYGAEARRQLLPSPLGEGQRVEAVAWPALAAFSAAEVAGFFASALRPR